ncbi:MAG: hypothetical protein HY685_01165, partial [Chloroflexi bacterium]|nr:hypothetical protein [Chloroflexota bacterium]
VSASDLHFTVEGDPRQGEAAIRFGLAGIKNVGEQAVAPLVEERRRNGPYVSLDDFMRRADLRVLNRRTLESLIKAGALDGLGPRGALLAGVEQILARAQREQRVRESHQGTMLDLWGGSVPAPLAAMELAQGDVAVQEKLAWEKELAGAYFSEDPYRVLRRVSNSQAVLCGDVSEEIAGQRVAVAGLVVQVRPLTTKTGEAFVSALLQDISGTVEVTVWPETYRATEGLWTPQSAVLVQGKVRTRGDRLSIACDRAEAIVAEETPPEEADLVPSPPATGVGTEAPTLEMGLDSSSNGQAQPSESAAPPPRESMPSHPDEAVDAGKRPKANGETSSPRAVEKARGKRKEPLRHLLLRMAETVDEDHDAHMLDALLDALRAFPGPDRVTLLVEGQGRRVERLEFPGLRTGYAPQLAERLKALLGESAVNVEEVGS